MSKCTQVSKLPKAESLFRRGVSALAEYVLAIIMGELSFREGQRRFNGKQNTKKQTKKQKKITDRSTLCWSNGKVAVARLL